MRHSASMSQDKTDRVMMRPLGTIKAILIAQVSYGVSIVRILYRIDCIVIAPNFDMVFV